MRAMERSIHRSCRLGLLYGLAARRSACGSHPWQQSVDGEQALVAQAFGLVRGGDGLLRRVVGRG